MGPVVLFDKSFIEMLNIDEATMFDMLFSTNLCSIYYVEVLADLEKEEMSGRSPEKVVSDMVRKTPVTHAYPNVSHVSICINELLGREVGMRNVPVIGGGRPVRHKGRVGVIYEESAESMAFGRWQRGRFLEVEREFAGEWRAQLKALDHAATAKLAKAALKIQGAPKTLDDAIAIARAVVRGDGQHFFVLKTGYFLMGLPTELWPAVEKRWKECGYRPLPEYAPYTAHCLMVDVFFHLCIDKGLISGERPSNKVDIAYLYYLPFAMAFASNDKLHKRVAPRFLDERQVLLDGQALKQDMAALDAHYWALPEKQRAEGLFRLASRPPDDDRFLTTRLWKHFGIPVHEVSAARNDGKDRELHARLMHELNGMRAAMDAPAGRRFAMKELRDPDSVSIERAIPLQRGKWRIMPSGVEADVD
jgi:hypothetical protein